VPVAMTSCSSIPIIRAFGRGISRRDEIKSRSSP
jgi:hypothetical protein